MNLGTLGCMAAEADFGLRKLGQHLLVRIVGFVAIGAREPVSFMLAARPKRSRTNLGLVTCETRCVSRFHRRQGRRFGSEDHGMRLARVLLML